MTNQLEIRTCYNCALQGRGAMTIEGGCGFEARHFQDTHHARRQAVVYGRDKKAVPPTPPCPGWIKK